MITRYLILVPLLFSQPAQAAAVDLNVNATITPASCVPSLSDNGQVDFGKIAQQDLNLTTGTRLPLKSLGLTVICNGPVRYALRMRDNRDGSAHVNSEIYYGLGLDNSANKIGVYSLTFDPQQTVVGGVAEVHGTESTTGGVAWRTSNLNPIDIGSRSYLGFTEVEGSVSGPTAIGTLTGTVTVQTVINARQNLDLSVETPLDGWATLEVVYL